jgi:hypothetical protein
MPRVSKFARYLPAAGAGPICGARIGCWAIPKKIVTAFSASMRLAESNYWAKPFPAGVAAKPANAARPIANRRLARLDTVSVRIRAYRMTARRRAAPA